MKKLFYSFLTAAVILASSTVYLLYTAPKASAACGNGYSYCNQISFNTSKYGSSDTSNFPALFSTTTMTSLATVGNGGDVVNTVNQSGGSYTSTIPADLVFTSDAGCTTNLTGWEFESYNSATGAIIVHINIGTLSHTNTSVIYMCYGKASVTTQQMTTTATWDSNYVGIWHFPNGSSLNLNDSTSNGSNWTSNVGVTATTGQIDGAGSYDGSTSNLQQGSSVLNISKTVGKTFSFWIYPTSTTMTGGYGTLYFSGDYNFWILLDNNGNIFSQVDGGFAEPTLSTPITFNTWNNVVLSAAGNGGTVTIYLNGQPVGSYTGGTTQAAGILQVVGMTNGYYIFKGTIDETKISNTQRSADQILAEYNNQSSPNTFYTVGATQSGGGGGGGATTAPKPIYYDFINIYQLI